MNKQRISEAVDSNPQLLDSNTNYNNQKDLSYFIKEYKKARQIIDQCDQFYHNFIMSKMLSIDDIMKMKHLNHIDLKLDSETFTKNVEILTRHILKKDAQKYFDCHVSGWYKIVLNDGKWQIQNISGSINNDELLSTILWCIEHTTKFDDSLYYRRHPEIQNGFIEYTKGQKKILVQLGSKEEKLFSALNTFVRTHESYRTLLKSIYMHPNEYMEEWKDYVKHIAPTDLWMHEHLPYLAPISYNRYDARPILNFIEGAQFIDPDFSEYMYCKRYDCTKLHNVDFYYTESNNMIWNDNYDPYCSYKDDFVMSSYVWIRMNAALRYVLENDKECKIPDKNIILNDEYLYNAGFNYVILNDTPFPFYNALDKVKIKYDESKNILECTCKHTKRKPKWRWPSDAPIVCTRTTYEIKFNCVDNNMIMYNKYVDVTEEKY